MAVLIEGLRPLKAKILQRNLPKSLMIFFLGATRQDASRKGREEEKMDFEQPLFPVKGVGIRTLEDPIDDGTGWIEPPRV